MSKEPRLRDIVIGVLLTIGLLLLVVAVAHAVGSGLPAERLCYWRLQR